jgi:hypothetical protein
MFVADEKAYEACRAQFDDCVMRSLGEACASPITDDLCLRTTLRSYSSRERGSVGPKRESFHQPRLDPADQPGYPLDDDHHTTTTKKAEDRYQSSACLKQCCEHCSGQLASFGTTPRNSYHLLREIAKTPTEG